MNHGQVCAWCNPPERPTGRTGGLIPKSHGICRKHALEMFKSLGLEVVPQGEFKIVRKISVSVQPSTTGDA